MKIQAEALGRDPTDIQLSMSLELDFPDISGVEHKQYWDRPALIGTPHDVIQKIIAYQDVGVRHIVLATMCNDTDTVNAGDADIGDLVAQLQERAYSSPIWYSANE